jgi:hypothetical protein
MEEKFELKVSKWEETKPDGFDGGIPISRVSAGFETEGRTADGTEGVIVVEYVMAYLKTDAANPHDSRADYLGLLEFGGTLGGRKGTFVMTDDGVYENSSPKSALKIKAGTGSGQLMGVTGSGSYYVEDGKFTMELNYFIDGE